MTKVTADPSSDLIIRLAELVGRIDVIAKYGQPSTGGDPVAALAEIQKLISDHVGGTR